MAGKKRGNVDRKSDVPPMAVDTDDADFLALKAKLNVQSAASERLIQNARPVISTGISALDWALGTTDPEFGNAGMRLRSMAELFGSTGSGKSSSLWVMMREMQRRFPKGWIGLLASEEPFYDRMRDYGVNMDRVVLFKCYERMKHQEAKWVLAEQRLDDLSTMSQDDRCVMLAIDSVKGLTSAGQIYEKGDPKAAKSRSFFDKEMAVRARMMEKFIDRQKVDNVNSTVIMLNQKSDQIGPDYRIGANTRPQTSGGRRMEFECFYRIDINSRGLNDAAEHTLYKYKPQWGLEVIYDIVKNRFSPLRGGRRAVAQINFDLNDFDNVAAVLDAAAYLEIVKRSGNWYEFSKGSMQKRCNGTAEARAWLREHPGYVRQLDKQITARHVDLHKSKAKPKKGEKSLKAKHLLEQSVMEDDDDDEPNPWAAMEDDDNEVA